MTLLARGSKIIAILAAGAVIAAVGVAYALDQTNRYGEIPCGQENDADSPGGGQAPVIGFTTLEEIVANADAIIIADVDRCIKVHSHPKSKEIRLTDFEVTAEKTIRGDIPAGKTLTVQLVTSGLGSDRLMNSGERYVFFLTYNQVTSSHVLVGGPQGRFLIEDGERVYSLDAIYPDMGFISVKENGKALDDFLSGIESVS